MSAKSLRRPRQSRKTNGFTTAEFAICLFVFLFLFLFPMINLIAYATGAGFGLSMVSQAALAAGHSAHYSDALKAVEAVEKQVMSSMLAGIVKLHPADSSKPACELFVVVTNVSSGASSVVGPAVPYGGAIDTANEIYQYKVTTRCKIGPLLNLSAVPFIDQVPVVGKPADFTYSGTAHCENADGLSD